jgi:hypothetical protein
MHLTTKLENVKASLVLSVRRARAPPHAWSCLGCAPVEIAMFAHVDVILLSGSEVRSSTHHCAKDHGAPSGLEASGLDPPFLSRFNIRFDLPNL